MMHRPPTLVRSARFWALMAGATVFAPHVLAAQEGPVRVEVRGVEGELRRNVLAVLSLARGGGSNRMEEDRVRSLHDRARGEIEIALQPFGRYEPVVKDTLLFDGRRWVATYNIEPGPPVLLSRSDVRVTGPGEADSYFQAVLHQSQLVVGDPLSHAAYEAMKLRLEGVAAERGYLDASFETAVIGVDRENLSAEIVLHFLTGPRFQFGTVTFFQEALDPEILHRLVPFRPGAPYDGQQLLDLRNALTAGPYFAGVEIVPRRDLADGLLVPLEVHLQPHRPQRYLVGAGYGTDTGPRGTLEIELRRVNRLGHRAEGQVRVSLIERRLSTRYSLPVGARGGLLSFSAGFADSNPSTSDTETFLVGTDLSRLMGGWRQDLSLTLQRASYEVGVDSGLSTLLVLGMGISRVRADDRIFPTWGSLVSLQVRGSHDGVVGDGRLLQLGAEGKLVRSLGSRVRFLGRGEVGALYSSDFRSLPAPFRYFAGGDRNVRGYGYQSLGPLDEEGNVIGGTRKLALSLEVDFRFLDRWGVATFLDAGNALNSFADSLEKGAGIGLRWRSPIGLIRLDGAFALGGDGSPFRIHLNIGPEL